MDRRRRPRSPSEPQTERKTANAAQSRWAATQRNPASCRWTEQQPRTGAQAAAVHPAWRPDPPVALDPTQGQQIPGAPGMIVVVLEPGTDLELRLGDEVLVLAPQAALQLTLPDLVVVVVPAQLLRSPEGLCFPAHARWLHPADPDATWQIHLGDGCVASRSAGRQRAPRAPRDPPCSPPCPRTLLLKPLCRAAGPRRASPVHGPRPGRRPLPADFSLDLGGPGPWPSSALRPLPPSPSPGPRLCRAARRRPPCKARRRLF